MFGIETKKSLEKYNPKIYDAAVEMLAKENKRVNYKNVKEKIEQINVEIGRLMAENNEISELLMNAKSDYDLEKAVYHKTENGQISKEEVDKLITLGVLDKEKYNTYSNPTTTHKPFVTDHEDDVPVIDFTKDDALAVQSSDDVTETDDKENSNDIVSPINNEPKAPITPLVSEEEIENIHVPIYNPKDSEEEKKSEIKNNDQVNALLENINIRKALTYTEITTMYQNICNLIMNEEITLDQIMPIIDAETINIDGQIIKISKKELIFWLDMYGISHNLPYESDEDVKFKM